MRGENGEANAGESHENSGAGAGGGAGASGEPLENTHIMISYQAPNLIEGLPPEQKLFNN